MPFLPTLPQNKNRLAANAAVKFPARCHDWRRTLPMTFPTAADEKRYCLYPA
ncbi:MAG: hypothetical protein J5867_11335 [Prevotella sp.]|nr:hypothetical protein [Prevotella sp.]